MKNIYLTTRAAIVLLMALFCTVETRADVVTVGSGSTASSYVPCYPNNNYSLSQQIHGRRDRPGWTDYQYRLL